MVLMADRSTELVNLHLLRELITIIDGYRAYSFVNPQYLDSSVEGQKLGLEVSREWKTLRRTMMNMIKSVKEIPRVPSMLKIYDALRILSIFLLGSAAAFPLLSLLPAFSTGIDLLPVLVGGAFTLMLYVRHYERRISREMSRYFETHPEITNPSQLYLKRTNQKLIILFRRTVNERGDDPNRYQVSLYNLDYRGIKVVANPSWFRKRYKVIISG